MTLMEHLSVVKETRSETNRKYDLIDVIFLVISGIPCRHTIARILRTIVLESLLEALLNWVNEQREQAGKPLIAFDGKVLRRAYRHDAKNAFQVVTAYDTENGLVLCQKATEHKKGQIAMVRQMLDILKLKGRIVTLDALHCQRETLEKISEKKAHVVQVKKNQPKLWETVQSQFQAIFDAGKEKIVTEIKQTVHGRKEERDVFQLKAVFPPEIVKKWPTIRSIIVVERHRTKNGKGTVDTSYYGGNQP